MNPCIIFTGGPGSGKTTVLERLKAQGYVVVEEVARHIIQQQQATGGNATHTGDQQAFCEFMLQASIDNYHAHQKSNTLVFFDRGIPGLLGYANMVGLKNTQAIQQAIKAYRYHSPVFIFPPWEAIYCTDEERQQDFTEAINTYQHLKRAHEDSGYSCLEVPKASPEKRVSWILNHIHAT